MILGSLAHQFFIVALLAFAAYAAKAELQVTYETQGEALFSFSAPDDWQLLTGFEVAPGDMEAGVTPAPRIVSLLPQEDSERIMWTGFWAPQGVEDLDTAWEYLRRVAPRLLEDAEVTFRDQRTINGQAAEVFSGSGIKEGKSVDFAVAAVQVTASRVAFAAFIGEPEAYDRYEDELVGVLYSMTGVEEGR